MGLKDKILDVSFQLFAEQGYEHTTIEGIINKVGCSKGGFYHHYKSKEDILNKYVDRYLEVLSQYFEKLSINTEKAFEDQFNDVYEYVTQYKRQQSLEWDEIKSVFSYTKNHTVMKKMEKKFRTLVSDVYYDLLINNDVEFESPKIIAEFCTRQLLWIYEVSTATGIGVTSPDEFERTIKFCEAVVSQQLKLPMGSICFYDASMRYVAAIKTYYERMVEIDD